MKHHVALGDTVSWEVAVAGHILFLKPRERAGPTNLIVTTSRGGELRSYAFELTAAAFTSRAATAKPIFGKVPVSQDGIELPASRAAQIAMQAAAPGEPGRSRRPRSCGSSRARNMNYKVQGSSGSFSRRSSTTVSSRCCFPAQP
jgi:type IV secretion system protein VirB9